MTKEELEKEIGRKIEEWTNPDMCYWQGYSYAEVVDFVVDFVLKFVIPREERISELEKENVKLKDKIANVLECFWGASSGDDFEMAESAREVMEVLDIPCYRYGKVKSKLTRAKEIIQDMLRDIPNRMWYTDATIKEAEQFLKEAKENESK